MKNKFTAFLLILIALISMVCDSSADKGEKTAEAGVDMNVPSVSETVTGASGTETEDEISEIM